MLTLATEKHSFPKSAQIPGPGSSNINIVTTSVERGVGIRDDDVRDRAWRGRSVLGMDNVLVCRG